MFVLMLFVYSFLVFSVKIKEKYMKKTCALKV